MLRDTINEYFRYLFASVPVYGDGPLKRGFLKRETSKVLPRNIITPVIQNDQELRQAMINLVFFLDQALVLGLTNLFPAGRIGEFAAIGLDRALKGLRPYMVLSEEEIDPLYPNTQDQCHFKFILPQTQVEFTNLFGLFSLRPNVHDPLTDRVSKTGWFGQENPDDVDINDVESAALCLAENQHRLPGIQRARASTRLP